MAVKGTACTADRDRFLNMPIIHVGNITLGKVVLKYRYGYKVLKVTSRDFLDRAIVLKQSMNTASGFCSTCRVDLPLAIVDKLL